MDDEFVLKLKEYLKEHLRLVIDNESDGGGTLTTIRIKFGKEVICSDSIYRMD